MAKIKNKIIDLDNIQGSCVNCKTQIESGFLYQAANGEATKVLCKQCHLEEQQETKKEKKLLQKITVKEIPQGFLATIFSSLGAETKIYKVLNNEGIFLEEKYIPHSKLIGLAKSEVKIKITYPK